MDDTEEAGRGSTGFQERLVVGEQTKQKGIGSKFDEARRKAFEENDTKEWTSWIDNKVVRRLPDKIRNLDPKKVSRAPTPLIRLNKTALAGDFQPKSRLVVPGPKTSRPTFAHTAQMQRLHGPKIITPSRQWAASCFDVSTAFLETVVIKAPPRDCLP